MAGSERCRNEKLWPEFDAIVADFEDTLCAGDVAADYFISGKMNPRM